MSTGPSTGPRASKESDPIIFCSATYGSQIIEKIKKQGLKKVSKEINALILHNPYVQFMCKKCNTKDNYTIDDLVDKDKKAKYDSQFVVCGNCNELIKLIVD